MLTLSQKDAEKALDTLEETIRCILALYSTKAPNLHVRISRRDASPEGFRTVLERDVGSRSEWSHAFDVITLDKTEMTFKYGMTSRDLHQKYPQFLDDEDGEYWGSAIRGPIVVACSGVESELDEMIANMLADLIFVDLQLAAKKR